MAKQCWPAPERNKEPILEVLRTAFHQSGAVLELGSGTGQHAVHFAVGLPSLMWHPSDPMPDARESIRAWVGEAGLQNLCEPIELDATWPQWPVPDHLVGVVCINMIHISPWAATVGLVEGAARSLAATGVLFLYGPFCIDGTHNAESNVRFDESLRARNSEWGVRDLTEVTALAAHHGFDREAVVEMPASNYSVVFRR